jgi:hypothetical protein
VPPTAAAWAGEYEQQQQQRQQGPAVWGDEFASFQAQQHPAATGDKWAQDFAGGAADWADQFADGIVGGGEWAQEFAGQQGSTGAPLHCQTRRTAQPAN